MPSSHPLLVRTSLRLALAGLIAAQALAGRPRLALAEDPKPAAPPPTPVVVAPVQEVIAAPRATYTGFLEPVDQGRVNVQEAGTVQEILKRSGDRVKPGEVLATLANPQLKLDLEVVDAQHREAQASLAEAQQKLNRLKTLYEKRLIPAEQYENEKAGVAVIAARLNTTRATRDSLRERLKLLVVRSPIAGQIVTADLDVGEWVTQNKQIYVISNFDRIQLRLGIPGKFVNSIPDGAAVTVRVPEIGQTLTGRIHAVVRQVDTASGNFLLRIFVDNPKGLTLSGLLAEAEVPTGSEAKVKVVPRDAIVRRGAATQVVVVRENKAQVVAVAVTGDLRDQVIVVANDLKPNEQVVVRGNERLFPGMPVSVTVAQ